MEYKETNQLLNEILCQGIKRYEKANEKLNTKAPLFKTPPASIASMSAANKRGSGGERIERLGPLVDRSRRKPKGAR